MSHGVETHSHPGKEKVPVAVISKEAHANSLLLLEGPITKDFLEKGVTLNSSSHSVLQRQNSPYLLNDPYKYLSENYNSNIY